MKVLLLSFISALLLMSDGLAQDMRIGLLRDGRQTQRLVLRSESPLSWVSDDDQRHAVAAGRSAYVTIEGGRLRLSSKDRVYGHFSELHLELAEDQKYNMQSLLPVRTEEIYDAPLKIDVVEGGMMIIAVYEDPAPYIAGVVEAETGKDQGEEFYKVQAVISRTYALSNARRHEHEGFNLCDQVHCQVYHGISRHNDDIMKAVLATKDEVLVDSELDLITASFHSNCGGHTVNSEEVWSLALPYLRARPDTFCLGGKHAQWKSEVKISDWQRYIQEQYALDMNDLSITAVSGQREAFYLSPELGIERKHLRHKWRLKSTYFDAARVGDTVKLNGRGFGHGVGLCQEGAMNMIEKGYRYDEVVQFYYTDIHLIHRSVIDFFKDN